MGTLGGTVGLRVAVELTFDERDDRAIEFGSVDDVATFEPDLTVDGVADDGRTRAAVG